MPATAKPTPVVVTGVAGVEYPMALPSDRWFIPHGLGYRPAAVTVLDELGHQVLPDDVTHYSRNALLIAFLTPQAGRALLS